MPLARMARVFLSSGPAPYGRSVWDAVAAAAAEAAGGSGERRGLFFEEQAGTVIVDFTRGAQDSLLFFKYFLIVRLFAFKGAVAQWQCAASASGQRVGAQVLLVLCF